MVDPVFPFFADTYWAYFYAWLTRIVPSNTIFLNDIYFLLSLCFLLWKFDINCKVAGWPTPWFGVSCWNPPAIMCECAQVTKAIIMAILVVEFLVWRKLGRFLANSKHILKKIGYFSNGVMPTKQKFGPFSINIFFFILLIWKADL